MPEKRPFGALFHGRFNPALTMSRQTAINYLLWPRRVLSGVAEKRMAYDRSYDTDEGTVPAALRRFIRNRMFEFSGLVLFSCLAATGIALASWSVDDPSLNHATDQVAKNLLGYSGAAIADELMQLMGLGVLPWLAIPMAWVVRFLAHERPERFFMAILSWIAASFLACGAFAMVPAPLSWSLAAGLGGNAGDILSGGMLSVLALGLKGTFAIIFTGSVCAIGAVWFAMRATGLSKSETTGTLGILGRASASAIAGAVTLVQYALSSWKEHRAQRRARKLQSNKEQDIITRLAPVRKPVRGAQRIEPVLAHDRQGKGSRLATPEPELADEDEAEDDDHSEDREQDELSDEVDTPRVTRDVKEIKLGRKIKKDSQLSLRLMKSSEFELPPLTLLAEPKRTKIAIDLSDEVLEQNARMLEGVLDDFGVRGQIINVRPGPVVTLYELEPAPGIKSSRVISLADDIARSMSAISARVAVVQGRNVIGIELPNSKRETVYLREMLASEAFEKTGQNLAFALGKNIGGEPIFADLARMPHLLIAGTTGSGKSVGINTMILSLLYRLSPEQCKLIMIDPKMLELSVYEGIPHLLSPVVTDPRKAVVALKWAVREMEDRYRKMSKVGVRNIDGYNARLKQFLAKGEQMSRTVQTGFNPQSGEPIFEEEQMDMTSMPYIVVIIDEMADLMMVAGKDIEGTVQRLAQMARAAGIHVVMATQRPSVDVITGTIKANFPTRISFQVTSKIDSRTILGEQGAEQLLGQGDMLYMAGGGRISRLHGPFVADDEVEKIVRFLKSQGAPQYVDAVTEEVEDEAYGDAGAMAGVEGGGSGDDLYDQAVAVVLRDKKVSTSYVQRRLQVGYNKAASLIERMEKEGLISSANGTGKREILVPGDSARV
jgi:DNA segregation ATPase FtsK/SpoIIIE, S-DNA-T family